MDATMTAPAGRDASPQLSVCAGVALSGRAAPLLHVRSRPAAAADVAEARFAYRAINGVAPDALGRAGSVQHHEPLSVVALDLQVVGVIEQGAAIVQERLSGVEAAAGVGVAGGDEGKGEKGFHGRDDISVRAAKFSHHVCVHAAEKRNETQQKGTAF
jgi:hypothetical protein